MRLAFSNYGKLTYSLPQRGKVAAACRLTDEVSQTAIAYKADTLMEGASRHEVAGNLFAPILCFYTPQQKPTISRRLFVFTVVLYLVLNRLIQILRIKAKSLVIGMQNLVVEERR